MEGTARGKNRRFSRGDMKSERCKNYINGESVDAISGAVFENRNPSDTSEVIGLFPRSGKEDVEAAVSSALSALPAWKSLTPLERGNILFEAGRIMTGRKKELTEAISRENGKTVK